MSVYGQQFVTPMVVAEDMDTDADQYLAVTFADKKKANTGKEASGIIQDKPKSGEHGRVCFLGSSKYRAGGAIAAGENLTIATSGYIALPTSGDHWIGYNGATAVSSGAIGEGFFSFTTKGYQSTSMAPV